MKRRNNAITRVEHPLSRSPVVDSGKCVVQESDGGFFIMFPDGNIVFEQTQNGADERCRSWFKKMCPSNEISLGRIEWHFTAKTVTAEIVQPK